MPYIKLDTKIREWEWHDDPNVMALWIAILYSANWKNKKWHGITVHRGEFITSVKSLSFMTGLSAMQVRYCLAKLKQTGEITIKPTNRYTVINVIKWGEYQLQEADINKQNDEQIANEQQTSNKQLTTTEAFKHLSIKESKELKDICAHFSKPSLDEIMGYCTERGNSVDPEKFYNYYESNGWKVGRSSMKDWKAAVRNWEKNDYDKGSTKKEEVLPAYMRLYGK